MATGRGAVGGAGSSLAGGQCFIASSKGSQSASANSKGFRSGVLTDAAGGLISVRAATAAGVGGAAGGALVSGTGFGRVAGTILASGATIFFAGTVGFSSGGSWVLVTLEMASCRALEG